MPSKIEEGQSVPRLELVRQLLYLEQQLDAYRRLHEEELDQIRRSLGECRQQLLTLLPAEGVTALMSNSPDTESPLDCV